MSQTNGTTTTATTAKMFKTREAAAAAVKEGTKQEVFAIAKNGTTVGYTPANGYDSALANLARDLGYSAARPAKESAPPTPETAAATLLSLTPEQAMTLPADQFAALAALFAARSAPPAPAADPAPAKGSGSGHKPTKSGS